MADELSVVIKTKLEIDEAQFRTDTASLGEKVNPIKLPVQADEQSFSSSISNLQKSHPVINLKVDTNSIVNTIRDKLNSTKFSIKVDTNAFANDIASATQKASRSRKRTRKQSGVDYRDVSGSEKYVEALLERAQKYASHFEDPNTRISSSNISYKPQNKTWQASVSYEDSVGKTTTMLFSMDEAMENIQVTQLKLTDGAKQYRQELERSFDYLSKQEVAYKDLYSKAFLQKHALTETIDGTLYYDDFGTVAFESLNKYFTKIEELKKQGTALTKAQKRELETLRADAARIITEQQQQKWGATDFASKDVSKQVAIEHKKLASFLSKYSNLAYDDIPEIEKLWSLSGQADNLFGESAIKSIDDLNKWRAEVNLAKLELEEFFRTTDGKAFQLSFDIDENQLKSINHLLSNDEIAKGSKDGVVKLRKELSDIKVGYEEIQKVLRTENADDIDFEEQAQKLANLDQRLNSAAKSARLFNDSLASNDAVAKANMQIEKLKNDLDRIEVDWSRALEIPELKANIDSLRVQLDNADAISLPNVQKAFTELRSKIKAAGADCKSFGGQLKDAFAQLKSYFSVAEIFQFVRQTTKEIAAAVKEVDSAMIELKKVTNLSNQGYEQFTKQAAERSKAIGTDLVDYIAGTADFARLGYDAIDAQTLSESTNILYKVGDGLTNIEQASDAVIASMAAYGLNVSDVTSIVDKFNEVSNKTSIDTAGLTEAITRSASALAVSGLDLDKSLALIVAGNETTRDASATGTALKSLSLRIRGVSTE